MYLNYCLCFNRLPISQRQLISLSSISHTSLISTNSALILIKECFALCLELDFE